VPRRTHRSVLLTGILLVSALSLAACGAGQTAETVLEQSPIQGVNGHVGAIDLRDMMLVPAAALSGAPAAGGQGYLIGDLVDTANAGDTLAGVQLSGGTVTIGRLTTGATPSPTGCPTSATPRPSGSPSASGAASATPTGTSSPAGTGHCRPAAPSSRPVSVVVPAGAVVRFTAPGLGAGPTLRVSGAPGGLMAGTYLRVTFIFRRSGTVTLTVPVITQPGTTATTSPVPGPTLTPFSPAPVPGSVSPTGEVVPPPTTP
jgi:hypothetical protein